MKRLVQMIAIACLMVASCGRAEAEVEKPKIAVFPLAGSADAEAREHVAFSLRTKLNRDGHYEAIAGPDMADTVPVDFGPVTLSKAPDELKKLAADLGPAVMVWGEVDGEGDARTIRLKILDLRAKDATPRQIEKKISDPTELRFVVEEILQTIPGVKPFEHPSETSVTMDAESVRLWEKNPNLVPFGTFSQAGHWTALLASEKYAAPLSNALPAMDKVCIYHLPAENSDKPQNVLAMRMSKNIAENNGLACLSDLIKIEPNTRYRLQYRYKSDGPSLHVFVKGYTMANGFTGVTEEREIYRRQVPPSGATHGKWVTIVDDLNPQRPGFVVDGLRVDLYIYLKSGVVMFDDVVLKAVGKQTDVATDDAIKKP